MADPLMARLTHVGDSAQQHVAEYTLWYDRVEAQITIRIEGPAPFQEHPADEYRKLLHRLGEVAQEAAASPHALSWPDHILKE